MSLDFTELLIVAKIYPFLSYSTQCFNTGISSINPHVTFSVITSIFFHMKILRHKKVHENIEIFILSRGLMTVISVFFPFKRCCHSNNFLSSFPPCFARAPRALSLSTGKTFFWLLAKKQWKWIQLQRSEPFVLGTPGTKPEDAASP